MPRPAKPISVEIKVQHINYEVTVQPNGAIDCVPDPYDVTVMNALTGTKDKKMFRWFQSFLEVFSDAVRRRELTPGAIKREWQEFKTGTPYSRLSSRHPSSFTRERVARLGFGKSLRTLAADEHWKVRAAVAAHASCPPEILERLANDERREVRDAAAR